jgi:hypothetical protein
MIFCNDDFYWLMEWGNEHCHCFGEYDSIWDLMWDWL